MSNTTNLASATTWVIPRIDRDVVEAAMKRGRRERNEAIWAAVRSAIGFVSGRRIAVEAREPNAVVAR